VHSTTRFSPFYTVYAREPRLPLDVALQWLADNKVESVNELLTVHADVDRAVR
jgi:hypothetical protein